MAALDSSATLVWSRVYRVANRLLRIRADDESVAQLCERFIGDYCLAPFIGAPITEVSAVIEIKSAEPKPAIPDGLAAQEIVRGSCAVAGETVYLEIDDSLIVVGPRKSNVARVWIGNTPRAIEPLSLATVLSYAINAAMRRCGRFELHAAGLVEPASGKGMLFIGDSGSGKSTLTMALAGSGWRYLSDDRLLLGEETGEVVAWGWRRVFSLTEETLRICAVPHLDEALLGMAIDDPSKCHVEPRIIFPDRMVPWCKPQALFFTRLSGMAKSQIARLMPTEAMTGLLRQCPWSCYDPGAGRDHLRLLAQLAKHSQAYQLLAGRDLLNESGGAAQLLETCLN